jgi:hypothetical protein
MSHMRLTMFSPLLLIALAHPLPAQDAGSPNVEVLLQRLRVEEVVEDAASSRVTVRGSAVEPDGRSRPKQEIECIRGNRVLLYRDRLQGYQDIYSADAGFCDALVEALRRRTDAR